MKQDNMQSSDSLWYYDAEYSYDFSRSPLTYYVAKIRHKGLNTSLTIKDLDSNKLERKVLKQFELWNYEYAMQLSNEAKNIQQELDSILLHTIEIDDAVNWESLKRKSDFKEKKPLKPDEPEKIDKSQFKELPIKPEYRFYEPKFSLLDKMLPSLKRKKEEAAKIRYTDDIDIYNSEVEDVKYFNSILERQHEDKIKKYRNEIKAWENEISLWENRKKEYYSRISEQNKIIDELKIKYNTSKADKNTIIQYCEIVLDNSDYSLFNFPKSFEIDFVSETKTLIIDYSLPTIEQIPTLKEVKLIVSKQDFKEVHISKTQVLNKYDNVVYQIILRTIHELFEADVIDAIDAISLNGWVDTIDKATGEFNNKCIATIHVLREKFLKIDLSLIDPKLCFQGLKGISATKLSSLTPVKPIQQGFKNDKRFVDSKEVSNILNSDYNLASMNWEDFEHLVRELFYKEFSVNGGEVKVTQSSRDGGVDAIAFDPDPIRGGKIVIQAKRYTNIVGVSAVRDLWGTTMNEGATKGILVTTSNYGSDAYDFVKDKPLTLLNGNNLLSLLEKHGFNAKIDIIEAKRINNQKNV